MSPRTRRQTLHGAAALLAAFAGCSGESSHSSSHGPGREDYPENVELDPETYSLRNPTGGPAVRRRPETTSEDDDRAGRDEDERRRVHDYWFVASTADAKDLVYADVDGAAEARRFVEGTDFDSETIFVYQQTVGECYRLELCYVGWSADEIDTRFGRLYRDAHVACEVENEDAVATMIRIPEAIDPNDVRGFSFGGSSGGCRIRPELRKRAGKSTGTSDGTEGSR